MELDQEVINEAIDRIVLRGELPEKALCASLLQRIIRDKLDEYLHAHFCLCA